MTESLCCIALPTGLPVRASQSRAVPELPANAVAPSGPKATASTEASLLHRLADRLAGPRVPEPRQFITTVRAQ